MHIGRRRWTGDSEVVRLTPSRCAFEALMLETLCIFAADLKILRMFQTPTKCLSTSTQFCRSHPTPLLFALIRAHIAPVTLLATIWSDCTHTATIERL